MVLKEGGDAPFEAPHECQGVPLVAEGTFVPAASRLGSLRKDSAPT
jgi:hypothetical protein